MTVGIAKMGQNGNADKLSPSIWRDCRMSLLNDLGLGYFVFNDFLSVDIENVATDIGPHKQGDFAVTGDAEWVVSGILPVDIEGGRIDLATDGDDEDAVMIHTQAFAQVVRNSGNKVWMEARVQLGAAADQHFFLGFAEEDAILTGDLLGADEGVTTGDFDLFGFEVLSGDTGAINAISKETGVTVITHLADVTRAARFTAHDDNTAADFPVADVYHKFGMRFDGKETLTWFADGVAVFDYTIGATLFPDDIVMAFASSLKNHSGAEVSMNFDWIAAAYQKYT